MFLCTFIIFAVAGIAITLYVAKGKGEFWFILSISVTSIELLLYAITALKNPGIFTSKI